MWPCQVVEQGEHLTNAERRERQHKAKHMFRAATTTKMIERYGQETRSAALQRASNARIPVQRMWDAEEDFAIQAEGPIDPRPTIAEAEALLPESPPFQLLNSITFESIRGR